MPSMTRTHLYVVPKPLKGGKLGYTVVLLALLVVAALLIVTTIALMHGATLHDVFISRHSPTMAFISRHGHA